MWKRLLKVFLLLAAGIGTYNILNMASVQASLTSTSPTLATVAPYLGTAVVGGGLGMVLFHVKGA